MFSGSDTEEDTGETAAVVSEVLRPTHRLFQCHVRNTGGFQNRSECLRCGGVVDGIGEYVNEGYFDADSTRITKSVCGIGDGTDQRFKI